MRLCPQLLPRQVFECKYHRPPLLATQPPDPAETPLLPSYTPSNVLPMHLPQEIVEAMSRNSKPRPYTPFISRRPISSAPARRECFGRYAFASFRTSATKSTCGTTHLCRRGRRSGSSRRYPTSHLTPSAFGSTSRHLGTIPFGYSESGPAIHPCGPSFQPSRE
jgi:hypothetical protein